MPPSKVTPSLALTAATYRHRQGEVAGVRVRRILRTKLDDDGRPLDGHLYARHELESGLTYRGSLRAPTVACGNPRDLARRRGSTRGLATVQVRPRA